MDFKQRHKEAHSKLQKVALPVINKQGLNKTCRAIAAKLNVSDQTVINYVSGSCKDGFLTEAIAYEFQNLS